MRGQYLFQPTSAVSFLLIGDFSRRNEACCQATLSSPGLWAPILNALSGGGPGAFPATGQDPFNHQSYANALISQQIWDRGFSGQLDWDFGGAKLTSITAWRDNSTIAANDVDYSQVPLVYEPTDNANMTDFKQFSQELRLAGKADRLNWLVGAFYNKEILRQNSTILAGDDMDLYLGATATAAAGQPPDPFLLTELTGNPPGGTFIPGVSGQADSYLQNANSIAFFTDETYSLTDAPGPHPRRALHARTQGPGFAVPQSRWRLGLRPAAGGLHRPITRRTARRCCSATAARPCSTRSSAARRPTSP